MSGPAAASTSSFVPDRSHRDVPDTSTRHSDPDASLRAVPPLPGIFKLLCRGQSTKSRPPIPHDLGFCALIKTAKTSKCE
ncbi:hypothetical protein L596_022968 [Steinernema carpocapsae]|uniref:Uncharacterized protein n=1 Tax=Steinernema carpocapsae TaxID=34508 RepID=A0A4U5MC60_STECR|nr:hypothetical protein L596_022968 [Steinernema carpocapsae]